MNKSSSNLKNEKNKKKEKNKKNKSNLKSKLGSNRRSITNKNINGLQLGKAEVILMLMNSFGFPFEYAYYYVNNYTRKQIEKALSIMYNSNTNFNTIIQSLPEDKKRDRNNPSHRNGPNPKKKSSENPPVPNVPVPNVPFPENSLTNAMIASGEQNLPNNTKTQCYKNSTLHMLLSIIKNELANRGNRNINTTFDSLFENINNTNGRKNNLKNVLRDMLLGKSIAYERLITTYFSNSMAPPNGHGHKKIKVKNGVYRNRHRSEHHHDNNEYLNNILNHDIFSIPLRKKIFNITNENITNSGGNMNTMNSLKINGDINGEQIVRVVQNLYSFMPFIAQRNNLGNRNTIYQNSLDYIILQIPEVEIIPPVYEINPNGTQGKAIKAPVIGLSHNMNLDLTTEFTVEGHRYIISDISYYGGAHYISVNRRGEEFYYYNDLGSRRLLIASEIENGRISGFLPKTIMLKRID